MNVCAIPSSSAGCPDNWLPRVIRYQSQAAVRELEFMDTIGMCHAARLENSDLAVPHFAYLLDSHDDPGIHERRHAGLGLLGLVLAGAEAGKKACNLVHLQ